MLLSRAAVLEGRKPSWLTAIGERARRGGAASPDRGLVLLSWGTIAFGISRQHGEYNPSGLVFVCLGLVLAIAACTGRIRVPTRYAFLAVAVVVADSAFQAGPTNHGHYALYYLSRGCAWLAAAAALAALRWRRAFGPALALLALTALFRIVATPTPPIDVHFLLTDSTRGLLQWRDMYRQSWPGSHGLQNEYPYLPWTSVLLLPFWIVTHEVRIGLLFAVAVAAYVTRRLAGDGPARWVAFVPLLMAAYPLFAYQLQQSWTEPLLLALLAAMVLAVERGRTGWAIVALGVALATKQHIVLLLPFAALWPAFGGRRTLKATALGALLVVPWFIAGPRDMWDDAVLLNIHYPVLERALDVPAYVHRHGVTLGFGVTIVVLAVTYGLAILNLRRDAAGFAVGGGLVELGLDVFNKQSFYNHYTLVMGLFVIALAAGSRGVRPSADSREVLEGRGLVDTGL
jgi:hypothetical protein